NAAPLNGDDVIDILARQPACSNFIARKLWRFLAEDQPPTQVVDALAARLREHSYELRPVLREMFSSAEFYSPAALRSQIKSPVQFIVEPAQQLGGESPAPCVPQNAMRQLRLLLFASPTGDGNSPPSCFAVCTMNCTGLLI